VAGTASHPLTDAQAGDVYDAIRASLDIVLTSSTAVKPGDLVTASLVPASPEIDASDLANGVLNVAWAAKDVLFTSKDTIDLPDEGDLEGDTLASNQFGIEDGQPFPPPTPVLGGGSVANPPGTAAQLFGTFALPRLKVRLDIKWIVRDSEGNDLQEDSDFVAPEGLASPAVQLHLPPLFSELRLDTLADPPRGGHVVCLWAQVTLTLPGNPTATFEVGPVPVLVLPLLVPTIVVLCSEPNFDVSHDSAVLVVVPEHSPFSSAEPLFKTLRKIESAVDALRGIGGFASFLLGLGDLLDTIPEEPRIRFIAANEIPRLGDIIIKRRPWWDFLGSDLTFDDRVYSIFVFGLPGVKDASGNEIVPGTRVQFFNDTDFKTQPSSDQGTYTIAVDNVPFVSVRTLNTDSSAKPVTLPPDAVDDASFEPDTSSGNDGLWHTDLSSLRFDTNWLEEVERPLEVPEIVCARPRPAPEVQKPQG
jgi:hypothetical protein